jgi:hypothetical protein
VGENVAVQVGLTVTVQPRQMPYAMETAAGLCLGTAARRGQATAVVEGTMTQSVREAALRPAAAEFYPFLPARMWTAAAYLTELVARNRGTSCEAPDRANRVLPGTDFAFRGGETPEEAGRRLRNPCS